MRDMYVCEAQRLTAEPGAKGRTTRSDSSLQKAASCSALSNRVLVICGWRAGSTTPMRVYASPAYRDRRIKALTSIDLMSLTPAKVAWDSTSRRRSGGMSTPVATSKSTTSSIQEIPSSAREQDGAGH
jgi:hypothetical protein